MIDICVANILITPLVFASENTTNLTPFTIRSIKDTKESQTALKASYKFRHCPYGYIKDIRLILSLLNYQSNAYIISNRYLGIK